MEFKTIHAAKDYLAKRIVDQAKLEGAPLTEVERKMLYFTEDDGLSPAMAAVSEEFDRDYDQDEYEEKIGGLVQRLLARPVATAEQEAWEDAAIKLCDGDNYLTVLINGGRLLTPWESRWKKLRIWLPSDNPRAKWDGKDFLRMIALIFAGFLVMFLFLWIRDLFR